MSNALTTAVNGINHAVARATHAASNIANASLTHKDLAKNLVALKQTEVDVAANAKVISTVNKENKALLDTLA